MKRKLVAIALGAGLSLVIVVVGLGAVLFVNNRPVGRDMYTAFQGQDATPVGKVAIIVPELIMDETLQPGFWINVTARTRDTLIPWPIRLIAGADRGTPLVDPARYFESTAFTPGQLVDAWGRDVALDGEPYLAKFQRGEIDWLPPGQDAVAEPGAFLWRGAPAGMPTGTAKTIAKARVWYYAPGAGSVSGRLPHERQTTGVIERALELAEAEHGALDTHIVSTGYPWRLRDAVDAALDGGADTIVVAIPRAIYSDFEEFRGSFSEVAEHIEAWRAAHGDRPVKLVMAPPMGQFADIRQVHARRLADQLAALPDDASVMVALTVHGMPWDQFKGEAWLKTAPQYLEPLHTELRAILTARGFAKAELVDAQDVFADADFDPKDRYVSTNEAIWRGVRDGYSHVVVLPIELISESTDTMYAHAAKSFRGLDAYDPYQPIAYDDWSKPLVRTFQQGATTVIYAGTAAGGESEGLAAAFYRSIDWVLDQRDGATETAAR